MAFTPWTQQVAGARFGEEQEPLKYPPPAPSPPKNWWDTGIERMASTGGFTFPWQEQHWQNQPDWSRNIGKAGWGVGLAALGAITPGGLLGAGAGLYASAVTAPGEWGQQPVQPSVRPPSGGLPEPVPTPAPAGGGLPDPSDLFGPSTPQGQPEIVTVGDQQFWWNPTGGIDGTGGWDTLPQRAQPVQRMTPEQEIEQSEEQRRFQMDMLERQFQLEQKLTSRQTREQAGFGRELQEAAAAQQMAQMYAADPYKYWAQMNMGTPGAVARLTGGEIGAGEQFQQGVPLSQPSQQWWGNLLPSEQQQIMGGVNWLGVDPRDWYATQQRMIPGLGARQMSSVTAR